MKDHLDIPKMTFMFGPVAGMVGLVGNMVLDILLEEYPIHYTAEMVLDEPDWEDWRDFLKLNRR